MVVSRSGILVHLFQDLVCLGSKNKQGNLEGKEDNGFITSVTQKNVPSTLVYYYSWVPNRQVYSFIWHQRNMKKETDTKTDKSI